MSTLRLTMMTVVLIAGLSGCGNPASPDNADITGAWVGSISTTDGLIGRQAAPSVTITFAASGSALSGSWSYSFPSAPLLNIGGQLSGTRTGATVVASLVPNVPTDCPFTFNATLSTTTSMAGTVVTVAPLCAISGSGRLTLIKE